MSASVERDALAGAANVPPPALPAAAAVAPVAFDPDIESTPQLPGDHPAWSRDRLAVSFRARELIAKLRPIVVRVRTFWDHHVRSITIGTHRLSIDPSGSYRLE